MQTCSSSRLASNPSSNPTSSTNPNLKGRNRRRSKQRIEEFNLEELSPPIVTMADQRTMAQLLQAPTEGYEDAIVVPAITADNFELKHVTTNTSTSGISLDVAELKDMVKALLLDKKCQNQSPAPVKAVEESCVPCGGAHFYRMAECLALADLGASINLMPFSVWKRLSLPNLTPTCMTLKLVDRSISHSVGVEEDVYIKVGSFYFPADFVVVDFDDDPRVPLILERSFLKTRKALIDVFEGDLTLRVGKEAITFNLDQTSRYSANYSDMTEKRIDVIDMACEEYSQEVLGFSDTISSGNPTTFYDPIVSTTSPTLTLFGNNDFLLEEVDAFLAIEDEPTSSEFYQPYLDPEGDVLLLEAFLNDDPSPFLNQGNYLPKDQEKTTFTCPYGTCAYRHIPFGLCNAPGAFQRCMMAIFYDMIEKTMEVFMDDFSVLGILFKVVFPI
nr:reverse transcriptase domain-containing protein [Tanacetum cinerariifolium]